MVSYRASNETLIIFAKAKLTLSFELILKSSWKECILESGKTGCFKRVYSYGKENEWVY